MSNKKLFIPRKLVGEGSRYSEWNKEQPVVDGKRINQYDLEGNKQGIWVRYYDNGNIDSKGNYVNDLRDGLWEWYLGSGELYYINSYKNGLEGG